MEEKTERPHQQEEKGIQTGGRPGLLLALISPKPTPPLCRRLATHLIPHPAAFISPSFSL